MIPHDSWRLSVARIVKYWDVFDGVKCVAVAGSHDSAPISAVKAAFPSDCEVIEVSNDPGLREVATFHELMSRVESEDGLTFCCHGKGSTHAPESICQEWGDVMAEVLLSDLNLVDEAFKSGFYLLGAFRRHKRFGMQPDNWHYSGTFYWMSNRAVFSRSWREIDMCWFGTESWPGKTFDPRQAGCTFMDWCGDLYDEGYWAREIRPKLSSWREHHDLTTRRITSACDFDALPGKPGYSVCIKCQKVVHDVILFQEHECPSGPRPVGPELPMICGHRLSRTRGITCEACGGKSFAVFKCGLYDKECVPGELRPEIMESGLKICSSCLDNTVHLNAASV